MTIEINQIIREAAERSRNKALDAWRDAWTPAVKKLQRLGLNFEDYLAAIAALTEAMRV